MRRIFLLMLAVGAPLWAGWSAELEWFPRSQISSGTVYSECREERPWASPRYMFETADQHNSMAWRLGGQYLAGPWVSTFKYLFSLAEVGGTRLIDRASCFYQSSTATTGVGGWLWRFYFQGRVLARHTGFRNSLHWQAIDGASPVWTTDRVGIDALGGGFGGLIHLRIWGGLGIGFELDVLSNYLWADIEVRGEPVEGRPISYNRIQPGADGQLYLEYLAKGKKVGGRLRLGSYAEGIGLDEVRIGENQVIRGSEFGLLFAGLFIDVRVDF